MSNRGALRNFPVELAINQLSLSRFDDKELIAVKDTLSPNV